MSATEPNQSRRWLAILLLAFCAWGLADIILDSPDDPQPWHLGAEVFLLLASLAGGLWLWRSWRRSELELCTTQESLKASNHSREEWRRRAALLLQGFQQAIADQFTDWQLTPAEREVADYLLRGFSHKDIARFTQRKERTVRQHSVAIYRKAKLNGRAELSAFFLEGLLAPGATAQSHPPE